MINSVEIFNTISEEEGITIGALEKSIGASKGVLSRAIKNGSDIQSKWLIALIEKYPDYNYNNLLKGEFSTNKVKEEEAQYSKPDNDITYLHRDIKNDLKIIHDGLAKNFEVISEGILEGLRNQQKFIAFIDEIDAKKLSSTVSNLDAFLTKQTN